MSAKGFYRILRTLSAVTLIAVFAGCSTSPVEPPQPQAVVEPRLLANAAIMDDGYRLPLARWAGTAEPRAVLLALHGFNDYHHAFAELGPRLAEQGIVTYAYDQRGFGATENRGRWGGTGRMVEDAGQVVALLRERHPHLPLYLLGESMGGAVSLAAVSHATEPLVDGVVLVAPAVWARKTMPWYQRAALAVARTVAPGWQPTGKSLGRRPSDNIEMLRGLARDPLVIHKTRIDAVAGLADLMDLALASAPRLNTPALILYGENDQIVPKLPTCRMLRTLPDPQAVGWQLGLYPKGYHMLTRDLQGEVVVRDIAHWILTQDPALPSGHRAAAADWDRRLCQAS